LLKLFEQQKNIVNFQHREIIKTSLQQKWHSNINKNIKQQCLRTFLWSFRHGTDDIQYSHNEHNKTLFLPNNIKYFIFRWTFEQSRQRKKINMGSLWKFTRLLWKNNSNFTWSNTKLTNHTNKKEQWRFK
jgi:hypothetical protein